jgi:hypothetical protein
LIDEDGQPLYDFDASYILGENPRYVVEVPVSDRSHVTEFTRTVCPSFVGGAERSMSVWT